MNRKQSFHRWRIVSGLFSDRVHRDNHAPAFLIIVSEGSAQCCLWIRTRKSITWCTQGKRHPGITACKRNAIPAAGHTARHGELAAREWWQSGETRMKSTLIPRVCSLLGEMKQSYAYKLNGYLRQWLIHGGEEIRLGGAGGHWAEPWKMGRLWCKTVF